MEKKSWRCIGYFIQVHFRLAAHRHTSDWLPTARSHCQFVIMKNWCFPKQNSQAA
uniref:Uncharacterized protein n=1 Tax=Anguilla anguilla TaxID=7936 RepID=A0A0E9QPT5_ANGAN